MICYNITVRIEPEIETEWVRWQKDEHIPEIMSTGLFSDYKFFKLLEQRNEDVTYVVQYFASSLEDYEKYISLFAPALREKAISKWSDRFIAFRTVMEAVN